ncbi:MAG: DUF721 domain-containing protein [Gammaproteobacteria bacterium]|nr:DUF721 domain-containing protein [Gammaproteobacteria bacterium]
MKNPTRISAIVAQTPALSQLVERARELSEIDAVVRGWLPAAIGSKVQVALTRGDTLVLTAASAVWATRLRYEAPQLLERARGTLSLRHITRVQVKVDAGEGRY